ncbi:MAG: hypothetical protein V2A77_00795 [Pseudomonadota bacterium]
MSRKEELHRGQVLARVVQGGMTLAQGAGLMGLGYRQAKRPLLDQAGVSTIARTPQCGPQLSR